MRKSISFLTRLLPIISFIVPLLILYYIEPRYFEKTWVGRTYELFFLWLCLLELILNWEDLQPKVSKLKSPRMLALILVLFIPTTYVIVANYYGLNDGLIEVAGNLYIDKDHASLIPLSTEYLVFMGLFALIVLLEYGVSGLRNYPISILFLGIIGGLYTIDNIYPWGRFTPFQLIVPTTTNLAAGLLNFIGYQTRTSSGYIPVLTAQNSKGWAAFGIGWPCAGVESLLIYSVVISLFLSRSAIRWWQRAVYFVVGAVVTYFINAFRIVTIFVIAIDTGWKPWYMPPEVQRFHDYYGMLYSITWIVIYPLIILGIQFLGTSIRKRRIGSMENPSQQKRDEPSS